MIDQQSLIPATFNKKLTRHFLTGLSDQAAIDEAQQARRIYGACPARLVQEILRRRDQSIAAAKEYRLRGDVVRTSAILDQFLARTVRQPSRLRASLERAMQAGEMFDILSTDMMAHTTSDDIHALLTLTRNVLVARQMADRATNATRRAQRLHVALRGLQTPASAPAVEPKALPRRQRPRLRARRHDRFQEASTRLWSR